MKVCTKCNIKKSKSCFNNDRNRNDGLYPHCKECHNNRNKNNYELNKIEIRLKHKQYYIENSEKLKLQTKTYKENNKDKTKTYYIEYGKKNKDKKRTYIRNYTRERYSNDSEFKIKFSIRGSFNYSFKSHIKKKTNSIFKYTEVSMSEYIEHFKKDILWIDYCNGKDLHIDHIIPMSAYDFNDIEEIKKCWNPLNLRLLPAKENMEKTDKIDFILILKYGINHLMPKELK